MAFKPGNHERAWNDPPVFAYQPTKDQEGQANLPSSGQKKTLLNKRVAYPLTTPASSALPVQTLQPGSLPPACLPPSLPPSIHSITQSLSVVPDATDNVQNEDSNANMMAVRDTLQDCVEKYLDAGKVEDVSKRLEFLFSSWEEKLNSDIRRRLTKMCKLLQEKNFAEAETLQIALAVDYTTECAAWIVAIKFIISEMKEKC